MDKITKKIFSNLHKLNFDKVMSVDIWSLEYVRREIENGNYILIDGRPVKFNIFVEKFLILTKFFIATIYKSLFYYPLVKYQNSNQKNIFYIRSFSRPDVLIHSKLYENLENTTICILDQRTTKLSILPAVNSIIFMYKSRKLWCEVLKKNYISFLSLDGLNIVLKLFKYIQDTFKVLPDLTKHTKLVSFLEMSGQENIICQVANIIGLQTFGLEHNVGMYKDQGEFWEKYPINHYKNSVCKKILCWGKFSKSLYEKHTDSQIHIIGKAAFSESKNFLEGIIFVYQSNKYKSVNNQLLDIANKLDRNKIPISHWFKNENLIRKNGLKREGPIRKIVIGCSTNLLIDFGFMGLEVFVIEDSILSKYLPDSLVYEKTDLLENGHRSNKNYPHHIWKNFIECTGEESVLRYTNIVIDNYKK